VDVADAVAGGLLDERTHQTHHRVRAVFGLLLFELVDLRLDEDLLFALAFVGALEQLRDRGGRNVAGIHLVIRPQSHLVDDRQIGWIRHPQREDTN
jgi:hypothetical protein